MFGNKPFGGTGTSGFGSFSSTASTFGQQPAFGASTSAGTFGSTTNTLFGGAAQQQQPNPFQAQSTSLFGTTPQSNVSFGNTSTFGAQPSSVAQQPTFGNTSFFGNNQQSSIFSQNKSTLPTFNQSTSTFPTSSTFGQPTLFGQQNATSTLFGSGATNSTGTSVFSTPFQQQQSQQLMPTTTGTVVKFKPITGTESVQNSNNIINTRNNCICSMKEYENKSMEELRLEDYMANRNGFSTTATNLFGNTTNNMFENKNLFSSGTNTATVFPSSTTNFFGQPKTTGFPQTDASSMNSMFATNTGTTNQLFGQSQIKPAFGAADTSGQQQTMSIFGNDPNKTFGGLGTSAVTTSTSTLMTNTFGSNTFNTPQASTFGQPSMLQTQNKPTSYLFGQNTANATSTGTGAFSFNVTQPVVSNTSNSLLQPKTLFQSSGIGGASGGFMSALPSQNVNPFNTSLNTGNTSNLFGNSTNQQMSLMPQMSTTLNPPSIFSPVNSLIDSSKDGLLMRMKFSPFGFEGFNLNTKSQKENKENNCHLKISQDKVLKELLNEKQKKIKSELAKAPIRGFKSVVKAFFGDDNNNINNYSLNNSFEERKNNKALRIKVDVKSLDLSDSLRKLMPEKSDRVKENVNGSNLNESGNSVNEENKANVTLDREDYYTIPSISEMNEYFDAVKGTCLVSNLTIGRYNYGNIYFPGTIDVTNMNLDKIVEICKNEVLVYPDENDKPAVGKGLNRKALITIDNVWPIDPDTLKPIKDEKEVNKLGFIDDLKERCNVMGVDFVEYRYESGSWVFRTDNF